MTERYSLLPLQDGMVAHWMLNDKDGIDVVHHIFRIDGSLDQDLLSGTWRYLVQRHEALRSSIVLLDDGTPLQHVDDEIPSSFDVLAGDYEDDGVKPPRVITRLITRDRSEGFDIRRPPLIRLRLVRGARHTWLLWTNHHLILDGWSRNVILKEWSYLYECRQDGVEPFLKTAPQFVDLVRWLERRNDAEGMMRWRSFFSTLSSPCLLPGLGGVASCRAATDTNVIVSKDEWRKIRSAASEARVTVATILQMAWAMVLAVLADTTDGMFGVVSAGRPSDLPNSESIVGLCASTLPMCIEFDRTTSADLLRRTLHAQVSMRRYEHIDLADLRRLTLVPRATALFESLFAYGNFSTDATKWAFGRSASMTLLNSIQRTGYPLTLALSSDSEMLNGSLISEDRRIHPTRARTLAVAYREALTAISGGLELPAADLLRAFGERNAASMLAERVEMDQDDD